MKMPGIQRDEFHRSGKRSDGGESGDNQTDGIDF
jgi:hypothetical protein